MKSKRNYAFSILYCIAVGIASATIDGATDFLPVAYSLFMTCCISMLYFHIISIKQVIDLYKQLLRNKTLFIQINLIVAIMWLSTFYGISLEGATFFNIIYFVGRSLFIKLTKGNLLSSLIILLFLLIVYKVHIHNGIIGFMIALLGGLAGYLYGIISAKMNSSLNLTASQILASRFWLLIIILFLLIPDKDFIQYTNLHNVILVIFIAFITMIVQLWLSQKAILNIGINKHGYITTLVPFSTFLAQGVILNSWNVIMLLFSLIVPFVLLFDIVIKKYKVNLASERKFRR